MSRAVRRLFSVLFWVFFATSSLVCFLIALALWIVTAPFDRDRRINHMFSCWWASLYAIAYPGWDVEVLHRERIEKKATYVLVANHTSIADIVLCFCLLRQFKWVSKTQVFNLPLLGWNMRLSRYIPLVRGNPNSIANMMDACRKWMARGISIMMFPEGTRSDDGQVKAFKHGAFTLAQEARVPVVPIAIHGGHTLIPKHGATFAAKATLVVEVLPPVSPDSWPDVQEYAEHVRGLIQGALTSRASVEEGAAEAAPATAESP
jgi:1-acyl-sn-glycerol-3-phosphate acyltransferase